MWSTFTIRRLSMSSIMWWNSSNQLRPLRAKTDFWRKRTILPQHWNLAWFPCRLALQIDLTPKIATSTFTWISSLSAHPTNFRLANYQIMWASSLKISPSFSISIIYLSSIYPSSNLRYTFKYIFVFILIYNIVNL